MPDLATTESQITVVRWMAEVGQRVRRGEPLLEVETDKATMMAESIATGILQEIMAPPGTKVDVGSAIAVIEDGRPDAGNTAFEVMSTATDAKPLKESATRIAPAARGGGMFARNRQRTNKDSNSERTSTIATDASVLSPAQKTAARRLQASKQSVPHFYLQTSINADAVVERRNQSGDSKPAWDAFLIWAVAKSLIAFPRIAMQWQSESLVPPANDNVNVAVEHEGELFVLPLRTPADKSPEEISSELRNAVVRLRNGDAEMRRIEPAAMTITNLGMCNVESFIPIINPPETAILAAGKVLRQPVAEGDRMTIQNRWNLTLSADHRVVNGKYAADFLGRVCTVLETIHPTPQQ